MNSTSRRGSHSSAHGEQNSRRPSSSAWKHIEADRSTMTNDEFDDDEMEIRTPFSVREAAHLSKTDIFSSRNNTALFGKRRISDHVPQTPGNQHRDTRNSVSRDPSSVGHSQNGENSSPFDGSPRRKVAKVAQPISPPQKLINDENAFTPRSSDSALSPPRRVHITTTTLAEEPKNRPPMAFDPTVRQSSKQTAYKSTTKNKAMTISDPSVHSSPIVLESRLKTSAIAQPENLAHVPISARTTPKRNIPKPADNSHTPNRQSPLRQEILPSSSVRSSASELIEEIRRSGALEPRSEAEIHDRINASLMRMEQAAANLSAVSDPNSSFSLSDSAPNFVSDSGSNSGFNSGSVSESSSDSDADMTFLDGLHRYVPADTEEMHENINDNRNRNGNGNGNVTAFRDSVPVTKEPKVNPMAVQIDTDGGNNKVRDHVESVISSTAKPQTGKSATLNISPAKPRKSRAIPTGKLSGKYARKSIKERKKQPPPKTYKDWSEDQWDKLQRLVDSDVSNSEVINSPHVHRALGCADKQELSIRVQFLIKSKKR